MTLLTCRRKYGVRRFGRRNGVPSARLAVMLMSLAAQMGLVRPAFAQSVCPPSCNSMTLRRGMQTVNSGGTATLTTLNGGFQTINSGGVAISTTINSGQQGVFAGGIASATTVGSAGVQFGLGGTIAGATINDGGAQEVDSGSASNVTVDGAQYISGGTVVGTIVNDTGYQIIDGGMVTSTVVSGSDALQDIDGGLVTATTVYGGLQVIVGGAVTNTVLSGATAEQDVFLGSAVSTTLSGATQIVASGGVVISTTLADGATQYVSSGGVAYSTVVSSGSTANVAAGGVTSSTLVSSGGMQAVSSGGLSVGATLLNGGSETVYDGGLTSGTLISSGGVQAVSSGGQAVGATVSSAGTQTVYDGGVVSATTIGNGGSQYVNGGGAATGAVVSGGAQYVFAGAVASGTILQSGGAQYVSSGGSAVGTTMGSGGTQTVTNGGVVSAAVVSSGGTQNIASGGLAVGTVVAGGGVQTVASGGTARAVSLSLGSTVADNGLLVFDQAVSSSVLGSISGSGAVLQQGSGTTILVGDSHGFSGTTTVAAGTLIVGELGQESASLGGSVTVDAAATLRGHGSIGGSVANGGTVMPGGTIGTLTVGGNYVQGSNAALVIEVSPTSGSQLRVNGSATLGGAIAVLYDPGTYSARSYAILTATAISGRFGSVSSTTMAGANLNGLTQSIRYGANEIDLLLAANAATAEQDTVTVAPTDTSIFTALGSAALQGTHAYEDRLLQRLAMPPETSGAGARGGGWAAITNGYARADGSDGISAYGAHRSGFAAGFDRRGDRALVGAAIGYEHDEIGESSTPDTGRLDTMRVALYGSRSVGPVETSAAFSYGVGWASEARPFGTGPNDTAEAGHWIQQLSGALQAGLPLRRFTDDIVVTPRVGVRWAWLHGQGFAESGAGGQALAVGADTVHSTQPYVGLSLTRALRTGDRPADLHVDLTYARELANRARALTVVVTDGTSFVAPGAALARETVMLGAGVHALIGRAWSVSGDASTQFRSGSMFDVRLRYRF